MTSWGLQDRLVPVSGAASGIGLEICKRLRADGALPVLIDRDEDQLHKAFEQVYAPLVATEYSKYCFQLDVRDSSAIDSCFKDIEHRHGKSITHAVANAGIRILGKTLDVSDTQWNEVIDVNLNGLFFFCRAAGRHIAQAKGGAIVTISSVSGLVASAERPSYSASKGAVVNLTRALAIDLGPLGIRVNSVAPGVIDTPLYRQNSPAHIEKSTVKTVLKRLGRPVEIANAVLFLLSEFASYITGEILVVDGGLTIGV